MEVLFITLALCFVVSIKGDGNSWKQKAQDMLQKNLRKQMNVGQAKNVIIIVGDGMSMTTIAAARILKGQKAGRSGIGEQMVYENFPHVGLARTYATDKYVPDSASTATAFLCGVKTKYEAVGVDDNIVHSNCSSVRGTEVRCIAEWALAEGKSVGLVTNMRVTHATPAPLYSHTADRWWEYDAKMKPGDRSLCKDIARQLIEDYPGRNIQVILGGGRECFMPNTTFDPEYPDSPEDGRGKRIDNRRLIELWKKNKMQRKLKHKYVWNKKDFDKVDPNKVDYLLGLFEPAHLYDVTDRNLKNLSDFEEPTLAEMTLKAIQILSKNTKGFFLLVEGGLIDKRHHTGKAVRAVSEALDLEKSVEVALNNTSSKDTLLVVTADHSQGMIFAGYAYVGQNIFGIAENSTIDNLPYTSLLYSTGPGYTGNGRQNITGIDTTNKDYRQQAAVPRKSVTHSGEDVAVYATGPMSHLFDGVFDQQYIAHAMAYAACIGGNKNHCEELNSKSSAEIPGLSSVLMLVCLILSRKISLM